MLHSNFKQIITIFHIYFYFRSESIKLRQRLTSKICQQEPSPDENSLELVRPLLLLLNSEAPKPTESIIDFEKDFLQLKTVSMNKRLLNQRRINRQTPILNRYSNNSIRVQSSELRTTPFPSSVVPPSSKRTSHGKFIKLNRTQKKKKFDLHVLISNSTTQSNSS